MALLIDKSRVEFLGIEVIFIGEDDPRGSVWIEFNEDFSLLYGKNGAGKSTVLKAITAFIEGKTLEDDGVLIHGYARLIDPAESCSIIDQCIKSIPKSQSQYLSYQRNLSKFFLHYHLKMLLSYPLRC